MRTICVGLGRGPHIAALRRRNPGPGEIAIKTEASLISAGTELHYISKLRNGVERFPLGYCAAGYVSSVGDPTGGDLAGRRVIAIGWQQAIHAEHIVVNKRLVVPLPDDVSFQEGVFAGLAATGVHAVHRANQEGEERVLIIGLGLVGQLVAQIARPLSSKVVGLEPIQSRREIAAKCGIDAVYAGFADLPDGRFDRIYFCISGEATLAIQNAVSRMTRMADLQPRGVIVAVGRFDAKVSFAPEMGNVDFRYASRCGTGYRHPDYERGIIDLRPPSGEDTVDGNLRTALQLIAESRLDIRSLLSHEIPFDSAAEAYKLLMEDNTALGVVLRYS
ncbi:zinc-dependent alcohol dehydrogenase [Roseibium alexandrii]|uniref:zinc-dependent alcohol dehydrogenase n=1 Tax=Roseibium alexandrii TaxID=388408 RepID=UPI0037538F72